MLLKEKEKTHLFPSHIRMNVFSSFLRQETNKTYQYLRSDKVY